VTNGVSAGGRLEELMRREARVVAALEHPGIVPIHDSGTLADGRLFTVMKLVRGVTLAEHVGTVPARADRLLLFERICEPVAFAHARGVVHRDLKPSNVMVGSFGEVMVMDWGVALHDEGRQGRQGEDGRGDERDEREEGLVLGTRGYMAPEQAAGLASVDARADVHALGGMLFVLLTGQEPPEDAAATAGAIARRTDVEKRLRAICAKAMHPDAGQRYADAAELGADVARLRAGQPITAYPETLLDRAVRLASVYRTAILLVLTYLVVRSVIALVFGR